MVSPLRITCLLRPGEDVFGQLAARRAGQHRLGLGTKLRQLLRVLRLKALLRADPTHGPVVACLGFRTVPQPMVRQLTRVRLDENNATRPKNAQTPQPARKRGPRSSS